MSMVQRHASLSCHGAEKAVRHVMMQGHASMSCHGAKTG